MVATVLNRPILARNAPRLSLRLVDRPELHQLHCPWVMLHLHQRSELTQNVLREFFSKLAWPGPSYGDSRSALIVATLTPAIPPADRLYTPSTALQDSCTLKHHDYS